MLEKLVLHGVRKLYYDSDEQVYKVEKPKAISVGYNFETVDIDGFIDKIEITDTGHASVTFSVGEEE